MAIAARASMSSMEMKVVVVGDRGEGERELIGDLGGGGLAIAARACISIRATTRAELQATGSRTKRMTSYVKTHLFCNNFH